ncbi:MAG: hypothetical protein FWD58_00545 [Firmicutes bacterium]|nr:hypothetical protein [Bacillota bacterium]
MIKSKEPFFYVILQFAMLALIMAHAAISEAVLIKQSAFWNLLSGDIPFDGKLVFLAIAYGHILLAIIFTVCAVLVRTKILSFCALTPIAAGLGCFTHGWMMLFWLHNPSDSDKSFLFIFGAIFISLVIALFLAGIGHFVFARRGKKKKNEVERA